MKKSFSSLIVLLLVTFSMMSGKAQASDTLRITSTPDIYNLANLLAGKYNSAIPGMTVKVIEVADNRQAAQFISRGMLGFVSARNYPDIKNTIGWHTVVGRDVIVPVISIMNPALEELRKHGVSAEELLKIINSPHESWNTFVPASENAFVNYYRVNDENIDASLASFLGTSDFNNAVKEVGNSDAVVEAVRKDIYGLGFCKLSSATDLEKQAIKEGLAILPIDRNNNGILDDNENIYNDLNHLTRGIWIGKYPKSLSSNIYAAGIDQPVGEASLTFMKWVLTEGQKYICENGFNDLLLTERQKAVDQLYEAKIYTSAKAEARSPLVVLLVLFAAALILAFTIDAAVGYRRRLKETSAITEGRSDRVFGESAVIIPQGIYYDKAHTWAFMEQDGMVKVGIDDFLQHITGAITRINMKKDGTRIKKGEHILSLIQNGKHLELYAPVSGTIREHNSVLETNSGIINSSPYNDGWVYRIEPTNWHRENQLLFYADKYRQYLSQEFTRLKDFLTEVLDSENKEYSHVVMQDGGEFREGVLSQMGPEIWEDFQTKYIDPSRQIWFYELF
ncbi:MAG TPA: hypothetical protein VMV47_01865 [Bacteroidales bacterium]|nr:hypothetical protein [Bacteroidales bacterium]